MSQAVKENAGFCLSIDATAWSAQPRKKLGDIHNSPRRTPQKRKAKANQSDKENSKSKNGCPTLRLSQFQEIPWIEFGSIPVGETKTVRLCVHNPMGKNSSLSIDRLPSNQGLSVNPTTLTVPAGATDYLNVSWQPTSSGPVRCNLHFKCNKRIPLQAMCFGNGQGKKQNSALGHSTSKKFQPHSTKIGQQVYCTEQSQKRTTSSQPFRARTLNLRMFEKPVGIPEKRTVPTTTPVAFKLGQANNQRQIISIESKTSMKATALPESSSTHNTHNLVSSSHKLKGRLTLNKSATSASIKKASVGTRMMNIQRRNQLVVYDECWAEKQEEGFVHWMNYTLYPPEQLLEEDEEEISTSKMFKLLLQTRHEAAVRRRAFQLYNDYGMDKIMYSLGQEISKGGLTMRVDRDIVADLGQRNNLVKLLFSYSTEWLRFGLEIVFGEVISLAPNRQPNAVANESVMAKSGATLILNNAVGSKPKSKTSGRKQLTRVQKILRTFLCERLLRSADLVQKFGKSGKKGMEHGLLGERYKQESQRHTLKKFLMLVLFLDRAKTSNLLTHCPCLFSKNAAVKSSKGMLIEFCKNFLSGEGDILRHLSTLNYDVSHVQVPLDEIDFHIKTLAVDLRDGLRLVRLVEVLTKNDGGVGGDFTISRLLRLPAVSRLQKLHNVKLALSTLCEHGVDCENNISGGLAPRDIVDGHREKTLALLWKLIFHFRLSMLLDQHQLQREISTISCVRARGRIQTSKYDTPLYSDQPEVRLLLLWCREVCSEYGLRIANFTSSFADGKALCLLIHHYHPKLLPRCKIQETTDDFVIKHSSESKIDITGKIKQADQEKALKGERSNFSLANCAAAALGSVPIMMPEFDTRNMPEEKLVITFTTYLCKRLLDSSTEIRATMKIQRTWLRYHSVKVDAARLVQVSTARKIQEWWFGLNEQRAQRHATLVRSKAATLIQSAMRGHAAKMAYEERKRNATIIQRCQRRCMAIQRFKHKQHGAIMIQRCYRANLEENKVRKWRAAIVNIQRTSRGMVVRRQLSSQHQAATLVQAAVRGHMRSSSYVRMLKSAVMLQAFMRGHAAKFEYEQATSAVIVVQRMARGMVVRRQLSSQHQAATLVQAAVRGHMRSSSYVRMLKSAVMLQAFMRGHAAKFEYEQARTAAMVIQSALRAVQIRVHHKNVTAVIAVQSLLRGMVVRHQLSSQHQAATLVQAAVRGHMRSSSYVRMLKSAVMLQAFMRGHAAKFEYEQATSAVIVGQRMARGMVVRRQLSSQHQAATLVQAAVRGHMRSSSYVRMLKSAVMLQAFMRGHAAKFEYEQATSAVIVVQRMARGMVVRRQLSSQHQAATLVQAAVRGHMRSSSYVRMLKSAVMLQAFMRGHAAKFEYEQARTAAMVIQSALRAVQIRVHHKNVTAVIAVQSLLRGMVVRRQLSSQHQAATLVQAAVRGHMRSSSYVRMLKSAVMLQAFMRGHAAKFEYEQATSAVIVVQRMARGMVVRRQLSSQHQAATLVQAAVRGHMRSSSYVRMLKSAVMLQAFMRGHAAKFEYEQARTAAMVIQSALRAVQIRVHHKNVTAVIAVQSLLRGMVVRHQLSSQHQAATLVQAAVRGHMRSSSYVRMLKSAVMLQAFMRGHAAKFEYEQATSAVIVVQRMARGMVVRRQLSSQHQAATLVQAAVRGHMRSSSYVRMLKSAVMLQAFMRGHAAKFEYEQARTAAMVIQSALRAVQIRVHHKNVTAVIAVQSLLRGMVVRRQLSSQHQAATLVQAAVRGHMRSSSYVRMLKSAVMLQAFMRGHAAKFEYEQATSAVIVVQRMARGMVVRRQLSSQHQAATLVQAAVRGHMRNSSYVRMLKSAVMLQAFMRGHAAKFEYEQARTAAMVIQDRTRYYFHRRVYAAVSIQSLARGASARILHHLHRMEALQLKQQRCIETRAAGLIHRFVRAHLFRARQDSAASVIQRLAFRISVESRRRKFVRSITLFQSSFRGVGVRRRMNAPLKKCLFRISKCNESATEEMQLGNRTASALSILAGSSKLAVVMKACQTLATATSLSDVCCENFARQEAVPIIYSMVRSCNRSEPHLELLKFALCTLRNVSKHAHLVGYVAQPCEAVEVLVDLLQMFRDKESTFRLAAHVLILVSKHKACTCKQSEWLNADVKRRITSIFKLLNRKHEMDNKTNKGSSCARSVAALQVLVNFLKSIEKK